ncbi:MAG: sugar phosphate isomerase/epimerase [Planctomycetes bacterium]|nr:sugar phosphate isomerase/epimerase [Planctomycetota bacterium]
MARISMNEMTTYRWTFEEDVVNYAACGFSALSVWRQKLSDFGEERGEDLLAEHRMKVASVLWAGGFTGMDGRSYRESVDDARDGLRLAADLNAESLVIYSGSRAGHTYNHARRILRAALGELCPLAEDLGVDLALEPMHVNCAGEWTFLTSLSDAASLLAELDCPRLRLLFDTYHFGHDPGLLEKLEELAPRIALVHLGDGKAPPGDEQNRCRLGQGSIPLQAIVDALRRGGYDGYYDVELIGEEIESSDYRDLLTQSRRSAEELLQQR